MGQTSLILVGLILIMLLGWVTVGTAGSFHHNDDRFSIETFESVSEAVDSIRAILKGQGLEIVGVIDHAANASK